jgi:hypothetical protein
MFTVESYRFARESDKSRELLLRRFAREDGTIVIDEFPSMAFECFLDALYKEYVYLFNLPLNDHSGSCDGGKVVVICMHESGKIPYHREGQPLRDDEEGRRSSRLLSAGAICTDGGWIAMTSVLLG